MKQYCICICFEVSFRKTHNCLTVPAPSLFPAPLHSTKQEVFGFAWHSSLQMWIVYLYAEGRRRLDLHTTCFMKLNKRSVIVGAQILFLYSFPKAWETIHILSVRIALSCHFKRQPCLINQWRKTYFCIISAFTGLVVSKATFQYLWLTH